MKRSPWFLVSVVFLASCQSGDPLHSIVSQTFVHKYGFDLSEAEWEQRAKEGKVVSTLNNGVKITRSFENGHLHGPATYTFPHSTIVEKLQIYDQGVLLKEITHDPSGMPMREEIYEFDDRMIVTLWNEKGVPLSVEEYDGEILIDGKYYTADHTCDAKVENGCGERMKRDRQGTLISRDKIWNGLLAERSTFHPNGEVHTISRYQDYQLHGPQEKFTISGKPLMTLQWDHGVLHGVKTVYRNGIKAAEIPYVHGEREGTEVRFDDCGNLTAEIPWRGDKKHGCSKLYTEEMSETDWFFNGQEVSSNKFELLEQREQLAAQLNEMEGSGRHSEAR